MIDKKSPIPVYVQLGKIIEEAIKNQEYLPGAAIPSERVWSEQYGISRMTVRQAFGSLIRAGVLTSERGKGTFVTKARLRMSNIKSFTEITKEMGKEPSTEVLGFSTGVKDEKIAELLDLAADAFFYKLRRIRFADQIPVAIEEVYLPAVNFSGLESLDLSGSLYRLIRESFQMEVVRLENRIAAVLPDKETKEELRISGNLPLLLIEGVKYGLDGSKLFFERDIYRSDEYDYYVTII